jgi:uncharacterized protein YoxC
MTSQSNNTPVLITIVISAVALVGFIVYLSANGKDTSDALQLIAMVVPVVILQVLNSTKINKIEAQTNGSLTKRLDNLGTDIKEHVTSTLNESAPPAIVTAPPLPDPHESKAE